mmetsp:Transcript_50148/g.68517  ORF Transcript_50148/g.68517 Transcript_50148/m.68517 type:complete len:93 (+) Transcript_50148:604-882(+)
MKVVTSFGRHQREISKFRKWSERARNVGQSFQMNLSVMTGLMKFAIFSFYTYSFYLGSIYIENGTYGATEVLTSIIALITGLVAIVAALPNV